MGLGTSLVLMAVGAVLRWAVSATTSGINLHTVGLIVLIVGAIGFVISLFWMVAWTDRTGREADARAAAADARAADRYRPQPRA